MHNRNNKVDTTIVEVIAMSGFDKALAYAVPSVCQANLEVGSLVRIPLRRRSELGVVTRFGTDQEVPPGKLKMLFEIVQPYPVMPPALHFSSQSADCRGIDCTGKTRPKAGRVTALHTPTIQATRTGRCYQANAA